MKKQALVVAICVLLSVACVHTHPHGMPPGQAKKSLHVHGHQCGHVYVGGTWVVSAKNGKH
jgi:hypothetical protein